MTAKVTVQPSGHEFILEPGDTLLDGALRSGLNIQYSCCNGTCGECKARLLSGSLCEVIPHDYRLSAQEKTDNTILLCRCKTEQDLVIEAHEAHSPAEMPHQLIEASVAKMERPTDDVLVMQVRTPRSRTLRFLAGQYVKLTFPGQAPRYKSIASCPCNGMMLHFHVRIRDDDDFSQFVTHNVKQRQKLNLEGPYGSITLDDDSRRPILFIAYQTGFSMIKSLMEHAISLDLPQPIHLYWIADNPQDHYLANYARAWREALDDYQYTPICTNEINESDLDMSILSDQDKHLLGDFKRDLLLAAARILKDYPDLSEYDIYLNGPRDVKPVCKTILMNHNACEARLFIDELKHV